MHREHQIFLNLLDYLIEHTNWCITGYDNLSTGRLSNIQQHLDNSRFTFINKSISTIVSLKDYTRVFHLATLPRIQSSFELVTEHI